MPWRKFYVEPKGLHTMPDGSAECQIIISELRRIEAQHAAFAEYASQQIEAMKASLSELKEQRAEERGQFSGAQWALARVGAGVVVLLSMVGWIVTGDHWQQIKRALQ